jgi:hypothetical protein
MSVTVMNVDMYENVLFFSIAGQPDEDGGFGCDLLLGGDLPTLQAGLTAKMLKHPDFAKVIVQAAARYWDLKYLDQKRDGKD